MGKIVFTGVDGHLVGIAANYALELAGPNDKLIFSSPNLDGIPNETKERWTSKGAEVCFASYDDVPSMEKVFKDADVVGFVSTWMIGNIRRQQMRRAISVAKRVGAKRLCYTSCIGAGIEKDTPLVASDHRDTEQAIYETGLAWNIQRDNLYLDTYFWWFFPWIAKFCDNKWHWNSGGTPASFVAREDCGRVYGALMMGKSEPNVVHDVTGPEMYSDYDLLKMACEHTGWKCEIVEITDEQAYEYWGSLGLPRNSEGDFSKSPIPICCDDIVQNQRSTRLGIMSVSSDSVERLTGRKPLSAKDVMLQYEEFLPRPA
ncbi:MAG: hypothetical protein M1834_005190 [Cirrosporium novae-zelandiae]|nr:MAG: hypothetical protein M1834_005190 [Cirrosporium novae-zelandiae]